jgi:hypothetical protein
MHLFAASRQIWEHPLNSADWSANCPCTNASWLNNFKQTRQARLHHGVHGTGTARTMLRCSSNPTTTSPMPLKKPFGRSIQARTEQSQAACWSLEQELQRVKNTSEKHQGKIQGLRSILSRFPRERTIRAFRSWPRTSSKSYNVSAASWLSSAAIVPGLRCCSSWRSSLQTTKT